jgi:hypothetical protein
MFKNYQHSENPLCNAVYVEYQPEVISVEQTTTSPNFFLIKRGIEPLILTGNHPPFLPIRWSRVPNIIHI